jgi:hypothetical protein
LYFGESCPVSLLRFRAPLQSYQKSVLIRGTNLFFSLVARFRCHFFVSRTTVGYSFKISILASYVKI